MGNQNIHFHYRHATESPRGPISLNRLINMYRKGEITDETLISMDGKASWSPHSAYRDMLAPILESEWENICPRCQTIIDHGTHTCPACSRQLRPKKNTVFHYILHAFRLYAVSSGRTTRAEYWTFLLINIGITLALRLIYSTTSSHQDLVGGILFGYAALVITPLVFSTIRRSQDSGISASWYCLLVVIHTIVRRTPLPAYCAASIAVLAFIAISVVLLRDSEPGPNQYGPSTKYP